MKRFLDQRSDLSPATSSSSSSGVEETTSKRSKFGIQSDSSKHVMGYNSQWEKEYPWLLAVRNGDGTVTGMLCQICSVHKVKAKYNKSTIWSESPCVSLRKTVFVDTVKSYYTRKLSAKKWTGREVVWMGGFNKLLRRKFH